MVCAPLSASTAIEAELALAASVALAVVDATKGATAGMAAGKFSAKPTGVIVVEAVVLLFGLSLWGWPVEALDASLDVGVALAPSRKVTPVGGTSLATGGGLSCRAAASRRSAVLSFTLLSACAAPARPLESASCCFCKEGKRSNWRAMIWAKSTPKLAPATGRTPAAWPAPKEVLVLLVAGALAGNWVGLCKFMAFQNE